MARLGDFLHAWWRGDYIHATFARVVSIALRALAYETMRAAKERIVRRPFMTSRFKQTKSGKYRFRRVQEFRYGLTQVRKRKYRIYQKSTPGQSPTNQRGVLRSSIKYDFRGPGSQVGSFTRDLSVPGSSSASSVSGDTMESFAGAVALPSSRHWSFTDGMATHALEWGGWSRNHQGRLVRIEARPFVRPSAVEVLQSTLLRRVLENSLPRQSTPTFGIGWMRT